VLYVQAPGDPPVSADLASWFTERAFHFYETGLRLPATTALTARRARRDLGPAFADLDAACTRLRQADGMASVIVTAQGRAAVAAALWSDSREAIDALILSAPAWPRGRLHLHVACPVLVLAQEGAAPAVSRLWRPRARRRAVSPVQLGSHVTCLAIPDASADRRRFLGELGRWLGAYMYGPVRDQLL
jgi:hypothetical protein